MPRPLHDMKQPQAGPTAGDLGQSAYEHSLRADRSVSAPGREQTVRAWEAPEPRNPPPGRERGDGPAIRMGREARD
ncbi:hypothetical protein J2Z79_001753 [Symbiobacterium terraclitae]|uniref:Uncharacterized protein n=1 Tax=Symbiobacterium terraclitae TaxID=557451 RepID=A0ABS4JTR9_9FIRM|nr:hypothetical protein [Symbiobacterium terraclitae]MBP2018345.1 hypothetical protein [Symbiobacterium terraclitae]